MRTRPYPSPRRRVLHVQHRYRTPLRPRPTAPSPHTDVGESRERVRAPIRPPDGYRRVRFPIHHHRARRRHPRFTAIDRLKRHPRSIPDLERVRRNPRGAAIQPIPRRLARARVLRAATPPTLRRPAPARARPRTLHDLPPRPTRHRDDHQRRHRRPRGSPATPSTRPFRASPHEIITPRAASFPPRPFPRAPVLPRSRVRATGGVLRRHPASPVARELPSDADDARESPDASGIERPAAQRSLGLGRLERKVFYTVCTYTNAGWSDGRRTGVRADDDPRDARHTPARWRGGRRNRRTSRVVAARSLSSRARC